MDYEYEKLDETTGKITYTGTETVTSNGASYASNALVWKENGTITLTFTDFFSAEYSSDYTETGPYKDGDKYDGYYEDIGTETGKIQFVAFEPAD
jgi:hypothetical protein